MAAAPQDLAICLRCRHHRHGCRRCSSTRLIAKLDMIAVVMVTAVAVVEVVAVAFASPNILPILPS